MRFVRSPDSRLFLPAALGSHGRGTVAAEPTPIFDLDFTGDTPGVFTGHAVRNLTFTRASAAICQISASAMAGTAAATNEGTIKSRGVAGRVGHRVNRAYTNQVKYAHALATTSGGGNPGRWAGSSTGYSSSGTSPRAGITDAQRIQRASGEYSNWIAETSALNGNLTWSMWRRSHSGSVTHQIAYGRDTAGGGANLIDSSTATPTWELRTGTSTGNGTNDYYLAPCAGGNFWPGESSLAHDIYADLVQLETGLIQHDCFVTTGTPAASAAEDLYSGSATNLVSSGRVSLWLQVIPDAPATAFSGDVSIAEHVDSVVGSVLVMFDASTRALKIGNGGGVHTFATVLPAWSAGDLLEVYVEFANGYQYGRSRLNGGATTNNGANGTVVLGGVLGTTTLLRYLGSSGGTTFDGAVARVRGYPIGQRPGWAI